MGPGGAGGDAVVTDMDAISGGGDDDADVYMVGVAIGIASKITFVLKKIKMDALDNYKLFFP